MSLVRTDIQTSRADTRADTRALVWEVPDPPSSVCQGESPLIDLKGGGVWTEGNGRGVGSLGSSNLPISMEAF